MNITAPALPGLEGASSIATKVRLIEAMPIVYPVRVSVTRSERWKVCTAWGRHETGCRVQGAGCEAKRRGGIVSAQCCMAHSGSCLKCFMLHFAKCSRHGVELTAH